MKPGVAAERTGTVSSRLSNVADRGVSFGAALLVAAGAVACTSNPSPTDASHGDRIVETSAAIDTGSAFTPDLPSADALFDRTTTDLATGLQPTESPDASIPDAAPSATDTPAFADFRDSARDASIDLAPPPPPVEVLVRAGSAWRYLDDGSEPPSTWAEATFNDATWSVGPAQLGYGDGDEATVVRGGPDAGERSITTYFRLSFRVDNPSAFRAVLLRLVRDDGAAVYLNGREVRRENLPDGALDRSTLALATVDSADESRFFESIVRPDALVAGVNTLAVEVHQAAAESSDVSFDLELSAWRASPVAMTPSDPVLVGAGDIARCDTDDDEATARLLDRTPGTVFLLGDNVYESGSDTEYDECFHPTWGRHRARTRPAPGNHDYLTPEAAGYYRYFGAAAGDPSRGYYSYDLGAWHVVVINSNCFDVGGCEEGSAQDRWLAADLATHRRACTLAYWHHPRWTSGPHGDQTFMEDIYRRLHGAGVDVILTGHEHHYERFAPMAPDGSVDFLHGVREFVVGTGGTPLRPIVGVHAGSEVYSDTVHGVLRLTLHPRGYSWRFIPIEGDTFSDYGTTACH